MTFEDFHKSLISDELWVEAMRNPSRGKDLKAAIEKVYGQAVSDGSLKTVAIGEHRKHVFNTLGKMPFSKVNTVQLQQEEKTQVVPYKAFATDDQRDWHLTTWLAQIEQSKSEFVRTPKLSHKQIAEEGDWLPKKKKVPTDPNYFYEHQKKLRDCQRKTVKERHPDLNDEEIEKYIDDNL